MYKTTTLARDFAIILLIFFLSGLTRLQAQTTQFSGNYAPPQWTLSSNPTNIGGSVDASGAPASISLTSGNNNNGSGSTIYSVTIPATGTISFDWSYTTFDDSPYDYPMYMINGSPVTLT